MEAVLVFVLAFSARLPFLNHVPHKDELHHVLAARALLDTGTLEIVAGADAYERGWAFTHLVAHVFGVFGESLVGGRMPAVIAGAAVVAALFLWVRSEVGRIGGWISALLMTFAPISLMLSQWIRFYTIHALLFFVACMLVYLAMSESPVPRRRRMTLAAGAVASLALALHLQVLTLIGIAGLGLWVALVAKPWSRWQSMSARERRWLTGILVSLALAGVAIALLTGFGGRILVMAGYTDLWAQERASETRFYHYLFLERYPTLWTLLPLALLVAAATRWRATLLCACVFGVAFLAHSLVAWKTERYLYYVLPMFFAVWGLAVGAAIPWLRSHVPQAFHAATGRRLAPRAEGPVAAAVLAGVLLFAGLGNPANSYAVKMLTVGDAEWGDWGGYRGNPDWVAAGAALGPEVAATGVVLASYDVTAIYALGRLDYLLRRVIGTDDESPRPDGDTPDFSTHGYSGVPIVSTPGALHRVMACHESGLVFIERTHYRKEWSVTPAVVDYLEAHAEQVPLPEAWRLFVYRWNRPVGDVAAVCDGLPRPSGSAAASRGGIER